MCRSAARVLTGIRPWQHITPTLMQFHWLPVKFCIQFKILLLTYKSLHALAPRYLSDLLHPYTPLRSLRSSDKDQLAIPRTRLKTFGDRAFCVSAPTLWNQLPPTSAVPLPWRLSKSTRKHTFSLRPMASNSRPHPAPCAFCTLTHLPTHTPSYTSRSREATLSILKAAI